MATVTLDKQAIEYLINFTNTAISLGLEIAILSPDVTRAKDEGTKKFMIDTSNTLKIPGYEYIVLARMQTLAARLALASKDDIAVTATIEPDNNGKQAIRSLKIKSKKINVDFRTMVDNSELKVPRKVNDEFNATFTIKADDVSLISQAIKAMPQNKEKEYITIISHLGDVSLEISDLNGDKYMHNLGQYGCGSFSHNYDSKVFLSLLKHEQNPILQVGNIRGYLKTSINNFDLYIVPIQV